MSIRKYNDWLKQFEGMSADDAAKFLLADLVHYRSSASSRPHYETDVQALSAALKAWATLNKDTEQ